MLGNVSVISSSYTKKKKAQLKLQLVCFVSHQSQLRDGSAQGPLLAVGNIY